MYKLFALKNPIGPKGILRTLYKREFMRLYTPILASYRTGGNYSIGGNRLSGCIIISIMIYFIKMFLLSMSFSCLFLAGDQTF